MSPQATTTKIGKTATLWAEFTWGSLSGQGINSPQYSGPGIGFLGRSYGEHGR
jgi:hypothetical protein